MKSNYESKIAELLTEKILASHKEICTYFGIDRGGEGQIDRVLRRMIENGDLEKINLSRKGKIHVPYSYYSLTGKGAKNYSSEFQEPERVSVWEP